MSPRFHPGWVEWTLAGLALLVLCEAWTNPSRLMRVAQLTLEHRHTVNGIVEMGAYGVFCLVLASLVWHARPSLVVLRHGWFFAPILVLAVASYGYSINPALTLDGLPALLGATAVGVYLAARFDPLQQLCLVAVVGGLLLLASLMLVALAPDYGVHTGLHDGKWAGVFGHKNLLGRFTVICMVVYGLLALYGRPYRTLGIAGLVIALVLLAGTVSRASMIAAALLLGTFCGLLIFRNLGRGARWAVAGCAVVAVWAIYLNGDAILELLGDDGTLNNRTKLWSLLAANIAQHPWFGHGFQAFWEGGSSSFAQGGDGASGNVARKLSFYPYHAHNGIVELALQLGSVGLVVLLAPLVILMDKALRAGLQQVDGDGPSFTQSLTSTSRWSAVALNLWPILYLVGFVLIHQTERSMVEGKIYWAVYVAVGLTLLSRSSAAHSASNRSGRANGRHLRDLRQLALIGADVVALNGALWAAVALRYWDVQHDMSPFWWVFPLTTIVGVYVLYTVDLLEGWANERSLARLSLAAGIISMTLLGLAWIVDTGGFPPTAPAIFFCLVLAWLWVNHRLLDARGDLPS